MSSGSESDDDYVPEEPQKLSEEESADDETEKQYENEVELKNKKRKIAEDNSAKKKRKHTRNSVKEPEEEEEAPEKEETDPVVQKKQEDELWAMFLDNTPHISKNTPRDTPKQTTSTSSEVKPIETKEPEVNTKAAVTVDDAKEKERRIFEFAGETIVVENDVIKERIKTGESPATVSKLPTRASNKGGLSGILGQLNKKNKLSTLEKSKLDWTTFKKTEGIEEEIQSHNKGKQGYLERRDFLERADMRQYEIERELRMKKRSNR